MIYFINAIHDLCPQVVRVVGEDAFDVDGNPISYDRAEVERRAALTKLRRQRDQLLTETDWIITMHKELGTNIPAIWKNYRQALRDLPANTEDPSNPVWPTKPS